MARFSAAEHGVPLTIIRIFSTYGPLGGAPADRLDRILAGKDVVLHPDAPNNYNPIYEDDYVRLGIRALEVAADPAADRQLGGERDGERRGVLRVSSVELVGHGRALPLRRAAPRGRCGPT